MKDFFKSKFGTILILVATIALAGIAIFTAFRLYKLRQEAVAPNAPTSEPAASVCGPAYGNNSGLIECGTQCCTEATQVCCYNGCKSKSVGCTSPTVIPSPTSSPQACLALAFSLTTATATATATSTPTSTATANPSGEPNSCGGTCGSNSNCKSGFVCSGGYCRNSSCTSEADCVCNTTTAPSSQPSLPEAGTSLPSILGLSMGGILLIVSLLLAL